MNIYKLSGLLFSSAILLFLYLSKDALNKNQDFEVRKNMGMASFFSIFHIGILVYFFYQFDFIVGLKIGYLLRQIFAFLLVVNNGLVILASPYFILNVLGLVFDVEKNRIKLVKICNYWIIISSFGTAIYFSLLLV
ncbi:hypothetical protein HOH45_07635 [bacterium]|nr:hypothetical protein [bacterium]